jgi:hypothetical protein
MSMFREINSKPYSFGEILDKSFREVFSRRFFDYFLPVLILGVIVAIVYLPMLDDMREMMRLSVEMEAEDYADQAPFGDAQFWQLWLKTMGAGLICMLLCVPAVLYILRRMQANILGEALGAGEALRFALDPLRGLGLILATVVAALAIWFGSLLLIVPGIILAVYFALLPACVTLDPKRFSVPLSRPFGLLSGNFFKTLGVLFIYGVIFAAVGMILMLPLIFIQMGEAGLFTAEDPDAAALEYYDSMFSPRFLVLGAFYFCVQAIYYLLIGCATVIMVLNYSFVRREPSALANP